MGLNRATINELNLSSVLSGDILEGRASRLKYLVLGVTETGSILTHRIISPSLDLHHFSVPQLPCFIIHKENQ